jgi:hypothetical protein
MLNIICFVCEKSPDEISEYVTYAMAEEISPTQFVQENEGTYNPENGHFCCTNCYIKIGMPSSREGWKAP